MDNLNPEDRRRTMQAVKSQGTKLEKSLFGMLAQMGLRGWRKNASDLVGKPDAAFDRDRVAVFVDGCFWHGCRHCKRKLPETNRAYWKRKIRRNIELAASAVKNLHENRWTVIRIWEHEMRSPEYIRTLRLRIAQALHGSRRGKK